MAKKSTNDGSLQSTKQMLDELDSLMERMLALPMNDLEGGADTATVAPKKSPPLAARLTVIEALPEKPPVLEKTTPAKEVGLPHPTLNAPHLPRQDEDARDARDTRDMRETREMALPEVEPARPAPKPLTNDIAPPSVMTEIEPLLADIPAPAKPSIRSRMVVPFLWLNHQFDQATVWLPGGEWLRSVLGRHVLGASGVAMTVVAIGWLLKDWLGWN